MDITKHHQRDGSFDGVFGGVFDAFFGLVINSVLFVLGKGYLVGFLCESSDQKNRPFGMFVWFCMILQ